MAAITAPRTPVQLDRRDDRYANLRFLWDFSGLYRVQCCSHRRINVGIGVPIVVNGSAAHLANLQRCGSIWSCPVCSAKIRDRRTDEIRRAVAVHFAGKGRAVMLTLTVRHQDGQRLGPLLGLVAEGFSTMLAGAAWAGRWRHTRDDLRPVWATSWRMVEDRRKDAPAGSLRPQWFEPGTRDRCRVAGTIRAAEVTHGQNGWHPHLHVLVFVEGGSDWTIRAARLAEDIEHRWCDYVEAQGFARPLEGVAVDAQLVRSPDDAAAYIAKVQDVEHGQKLALELARSDLKLGRRGGRSPFQILRDAREHGDADDLSLWWEYEQATHGRQAITWSAGLKRRLLVDELTDEEIAEEEVGGEPIAVIPVDVWSKVCRHRHGISAVLRAAEIGGCGAVRSTLEALGLPAWLDPPPPRPD